MKVPPVKESLVVGVFFNERKRKWTWKRIKGSWSQWLRYRLSLLLKK